MLVLEQPNRSSSQRPFRAQMPRLIAEVGTSNFNAALSEASRTLLQCGQITAFAFPKRAAPRVVNLLADEKADAVKSAASHYLRSHWHRDPSNLFRNGDMDSGRSYAVIMSDEEVSDDEFRRDCYVQTGVSHRLSVITELRGEYIKTSFHRSAVQGPFTAENIFDLLEQCDLLVSLIVRHNEMTAVNDASPESPEQYESILAACCPQLTNRERRVCSLIAIGMSSEAIALTLNVSINTILTFRRRAYSRLNISTQNELLRLLFRERATAERAA